MRRDYGKNAFFRQSAMRADHKARIKYEKQQREMAKPLGTMEALKNAFSTPATNSDSAEKGNTESNVDSRPNS